MDKKLLEVLACPACKNDVLFKDDKIVCINCKRKYPIKDDIPIMLIEESEQG
ncbi:MAG: Trm112 family protein [Candidatus Omnitrophota bacterium]